MEKNGGKKASYIKYIRKVLMTAMEMALEISEESYRNLII